MLEKLRHLLLRRTHDAPGKRARLSPVERKDATAFLPTDGNASSMNKKNSKSGGARGHVREIDDPV
jgi:hypothetical protein